MEKKFRIYTDEEEEKIERLRKEAEEERKKKRSGLQSSSQINVNFDYKVGNPVYVTIDGKTVSGYIMCKIGDGFGAKYEVKTPLGRIKDIPRKWIRGRLVEDLSKVEIPEEIKKYSTSHLLKMLNSHRAGNVGYWAPEFTESQIKAELRLRPHVPTKGERKIFKKYSK